jgi:hypothetical protein
LIAPLLTASPADDEARGLALTWLATNAKHPQAYWLLSVLVAANPDNDEVRRLALDWLAANETHPQAYQLIAPLVAANPSDDAVRERAFDWLAANAKHPQAYHVIAPLVTANPTDAEVRELAFDWLSSNEAHPQAYQLIVPLVAALPSDDAVRERALGWLAANETHPQAYQVLAPLVVANPTDAEVTELAADWLRANEAHPQSYQLLNVMIARSDGSKEWLDRGEQYVNKPGSIHPETVLGVLLTAGKANPKFIEMAFDFMENTTLKGHRNSLLYHLSRALVRNFHNAVQYLNGAYDEQRKKTVCASVAAGMRRFPDTIAAFALDVVDRLAPEHVYHILWNVITRRLEVDYLDEMIARWLVDNYYRRGYGGMLNALRKNPDYWERLLALGILPRRIVEDFSARGNAEASGRG